MKVQLVVCLLFLVSSSMAQENWKDIDLVDDDANRKTRMLYANLKNLAGKKLLFGHQDDLAYGVKWENEEGGSDVKSVAGSYPAVYGWDISKIGSEVNIDSVNFDNMVKWIKEGYKRGGVITISWHMDNPVNKSDSWDTTQAVKHIIPGGKLHDYYKARLDTVAEFFKSLRRWIFVEIPVVFRPFHEHTGSWFWWGDGNCTSEEYKQLWRFTVEYLRDEKNLHNILYAYSPDKFKSKEEYMKFYPGDDYVDILGVDDYHGLHSLETADQTIKRLHTLYEIGQEHNKVTAITETGLEKIPDPEWYTDVLLKTIQTDEKTSNVAWVLVWRNANEGHHYAPYPGHPAADNFIEFKNKDFVLFEDELPDLYKKPRN